MNIWRIIWSGLDWSVLTSILISIIPALVCITFHEVSHGFVACMLGDTTSKDMGRLTLNPIKHLDIFGLLMMAVFRFGWAKPVPVNMWRFRNPKKGMAITALAGPVSNILLTVCMLLIYGFGFIPLNRAGASGRFLLDLIEITASLSIWLAVFNLIPIPPMDGSKVLFAFLPDRSYYRLMELERFGMIIVVIVLVSGVLSAPLSTAVGFVYKKLFYIAQWSYDLALKLY
ncbi:MAG: site-2 protease family protein [Oscillospiraceae bacterium]